MSSKTAPEERDFDGVAKGEDDIVGMSDGVENRAGDDESNPTGNDAITSGSDLVVSCKKNGGEDTSKGAGLVGLDGKNYDPGNQNPIDNVKNIDINRTTQQDLKIAANAAAADDDDYDGGCGGGEENTEMKKKDQADVYSSDDVDSNDSDGDDGSVVDISSVDALCSCDTCENAIRTTLFHRGKNALDNLEIRVGNWEKHGIPGIVAHRILHKTVYLDSAVASSVAILGGWNPDPPEDLEEQDLPRSVISLRMASNHSWHQSSWPRLNVRRTLGFGAVCIRGKLYVFGGAGSFEVLDLQNLQDGWILHPMPDAMGNSFYCTAAAVEDRYIFVFSHESYFNEETPDRRGIFSKYDTHAETWDTGLNTPLLPTSCAYGMTSIAVPGKGSYVIVVGKPSVLVAYHVETQTWFRLPVHPNPYMQQSTISTFGNRYILVAGGLVYDGSRFFSGAVSVSAFDWVTKEWFEFPSLPEGRFAASSAIMPGAMSKWILTGGATRWNLAPEFPVVKSFFSLDISSGIGWAQEKLLLLCFLDKSQKKRSKKTCLLERLPKGVFANILLFLMTPFPHEVQCKGSIFASLLEEKSYSPAGKRSGISLTTKASKKSRTT